MHILVHKGPTSSPHAVDVSPENSLLAVASSSNVLLYSVDAAPAAHAHAQLRAGPSPSSRVTAVTFCHSPALTHLLATLSSEGHLRLFDVCTRRFLLSSSHPSSHFLSFFPARPDLLLLLSRSGHWVLLHIRLLPSPHSAELCTGRLPVVRVHSLTHHPSSQPAVFVHATDAGGTASIHSLWPSGHHSLHHRVELSLSNLHDLSVHPSGTHLALLTSASPIPTIIPRPTGPHQPPQTPTSNYPSPPSFEPKSRVAWLDHATLITSDPSGSLFFWRHSASHREPRLIHTRSDAHVRCLLSIRVISASTFVSASIDRTVAVWTVQPPSPLVDRQLLLCWRTLRSNGAILSISLLASETQVILAFTASSGTVVAVRLAESGFHHVYGEVDVFGNALSNSSGTSIVALAADNSNSKNDKNKNNKNDGRILFWSNSAQMGVIRLDQTEGLHVSDIVSARDLKTNPHGGKTGKKGGGEKLVGVCGSAFLTADHSTSSLCLWSYHKDEWFRHRCANTAKLVGGGVTSVCKAGETRLVAGDKNGNVWTYELSQNASHKIAFVDKGHKGVAVSCVAVSEEMHLAAWARRDGSLGIFKTDWESIEGGETTECGTTSSRKTVAMMQWAPVAQARKPRLVCAMQGEEAIVYECEAADALGLTPVHRIREHCRRVSDVAWVSADDLVTAGDDGTVRRWQVSRLPRLC